MPPGAVHPGEDPVDAAARELREEAGLRAGSLEVITTHVNSVHITGRNHFFMATDLTACGDGACDDDEEFIGRGAFSLHDVTA